MKTTRRCLGLLTLAVAALGSCTGNEVTPPSLAGPSGAASLRAGASPQWFGAPGPFVRCALHPEADGEGDIGPEGGRITVGGSRLIVPRGALSETVHITLTVQEGERAFIALEPTGLVFSKQARLVFDVRGCDFNPPRGRPWPGTGDLFVVYVDDYGRILEWNPAQHDWVNRTVSAAINHFSGYAVAW